MMRSGDRGSATAEFAIALPAVVIVLVLGMGALTAGATGVRLQDGVADAARLVARGDSAARAIAAVTETVPAAVVSIEERGDDLVCVTATARVAWTSISATSCGLAGGF